MSEVMNKKALAEKVAEAAGITKKDATSYVNVVFDAIAASLKEGNTVDINGFGKFVVTHKEARVGRNPSTGEATEVPAHNALSFQASKTLKDAVK